MARSIDGNGRRHSAGEPSGATGLEGDTKCAVKALVLKAYGQLEVEERPAPEVGHHDVRIRVMVCGICGSDVHGMDGSTGRRIPPIVMGHEAAGIVESVGSEVRGFLPGDRVTFDSTIYNPQSFFSRRGQVNLCDDRRVLGVSCADYRRDGAFAELVSVPAHIVYVLPPGMTFEQAALVEPVSVAVHARNLTPIEPGDTAVVFGAGLIGLMAVQVLRQSRVGRIVAVDVEPDRLALARALGADHALKQTRRTCRPRSGRSRKDAARTSPSRPWGSRGACARRSPRCARAAASR
jgi:L-iditol 2-dehydrogenase